MGELLRGEIAQRVGRKWQAQFQELRAALETLQMLRPPKRFAVTDTNGFKQAVSVKETAIKHRNHRLFFGFKLAVEKDEHLDVLQ